MARHERPPTGVRRDTNVEPRGDQSASVVTDETIEGKKTNLVQDPELDFGSEQTVENSPQAWARR